MVNSENFISSDSIILVIRELTQPFEEQGYQAGRKPQLASFRTFGW